MGDSVPVVASHSRSRLPRPCLRHVHRASFYNIFTGMQVEETFFHTHRYPVSQHGRTILNVELNIFPNLNRHVSISLSGCVPQELRNTYKPLDLEYRVSILGAEGRLLPGRGYSGSFKADYAKSLHFPGYITQADLRNPKLKLLTDNDTLTLEVELNVVGGMACWPDVVPLLPDGVLRRRLGQDFASLFDNPEHSDCLVECGGKQFRCHKMILSCRGVFRIFKGGHELFFAPSPPYWAP